MLGLVRGLKKTKERLFRPLKGILSGQALDDESIDEIEAVLLSADLGIEATERIIERLRERAGGAEAGEYIGIVREELNAIIDEVIPATPREGTPRVIVVIGVNGVGKTSTIGKLAHRFRKEGRSVLLAAADTFRAAAIEQLELWADRAGVPVVSQKMGSDPAAVAFDAVQSARAKGTDVVIIDTAGRLHTKTNLMDELAKIFRVLEKRGGVENMEAWLVLDANTGQNSLRQAEVFVDALPVTGIILTKLDSTAKGGVVIPIQKKLHLPVLYGGLGEGMDDLETFDHHLFVSGLLGEESYT